MTGSTVAWRARVLPALLIWSVHPAGCNSAGRREAALQQRIRCLIQEVRGADADRREAAADDLGTIGPAAAKAVPALAQALLDARATNDLREAAIGALERIGPPSAAAAAALVETLSRHPALEKQIRHAMSEIGPTITRELIEVQREHPNQRVRAQAARLLDESGEGRESERRLIAALKGDASPEVRAAAARALGQRGARRAAEALHGALSDQSWPVAAAAARALAALPPEGTEWLQRAARAARPLVAIAATLALDKPGDAAPWRDWLTVLDDPRWQVRAAAARALGRVGAMEALPRLQQMLGDPSAEVQQAAEDAIADLEGRL